MKKNIIIYNGHGLSLSFMLRFLEEQGFQNNYDLLNSFEPDEIEHLVNPKSELLILCINGLNSAEALDVVDKSLHRNPEMNVIIVSISSEVKIIKKFFDRGIKGFLGKYTDYKEFQLAITRVLEGHVYVSNDSKAAMVDSICNVDEKKHDGVHRSELTARELDVLHLICEGLRSKEIAERLFISIHTVDSHRRNIMLKFNINNSSQLVKYALENSLVG